jgi:hypothetical protein
VDTFLTMTIILGEYINKGEPDRHTFCRGQRT